MKSDHEIDLLLREQGDHWRRGVPIDHDMDIRLFGEQPTGRRVTRWVLASGSVAALIAILVLASAFRGLTSAPSSGTGSAVPSASGVAGAGETAAPASAAPQANFNEIAVSAGDSVVATGYLAARANDLYLCPTRLLGITGGFGCLGADLVPVAGADALVWDRQFARVEGVWDGEVIQAVDIVATAVPDRPAIASIPCSPPVSGWPGNGTSEAAESAGQLLEEEVAGHPQKYVGLWSAASPSEAGDITRAVVVGTVADVQTAVDELAAIYPFNLCVVRVEYSATDLQSALDELSATNSQWHLEIEPSADRVILTTTALDPAAAEAIAGFAGKVEVHATLRPV
jgi:hypothetical protein